MPNVPTTDQLRHAIDSGQTGEKVGFPDPAAAPLGSDAEAAGVPPTRQERAMEASARIDHPHREPPNGVVVYLVLVFGVTLAITAIVFLA